MLYMKDHRCGMRWHNGMGQKAEQGVSLATQNLLCNVYAPRTSLKVGTDMMFTEMVFTDRKKLERRLNVDNL
jgi:hypothetical protein